MRLPLRLLTGVGLSTVALIMAGKFEEYVHQHPMLVWVDKVLSSGILPAAVPEEDLKAAMMTLERGVRSRETSPAL